MHSQTIAFCNANWSQDKMLHDIAVLLCTDTCYVLRYAIHTTAHSKFPFIAEACHKSLVMRR